MDQIKKALKERGVTATVEGTMLTEEDGMKKEEAAGGGSTVNLTEASGSLPKACEASSKEYSKQTVDQINKIKSLQKRGLNISFFEFFPSKAKKADMVTKLVEGDSEKKQDAAGGGSVVNLTETSGSLSKASGASSKEGWIIETEFVPRTCRDEPQINIVGIFTSKEEAVKNAKIAFANMDNFQDADGWDNKELKDNSKKIDKKFDKGCRGGVLFQMDTSQEGDTISVSIYKCFIDKPIKPIDEAMDHDDADLEEDNGIANSDEEDSDYE